MFSTEHRWFGTVDIHLLHLPLSFLHDISFTNFEGEGVVAFEKA